MIAFVKSRATFKNKLKLEVTDDYSYCIDSAYENVSTFMVYGEYSGLEDDFLLFDEFFGIISTCEPAEGFTTIQCAKIVTLFARQLVLTEGETYIEDFMKRVIENEYKNLTDTVYAMPYLSVTITSHTPYSKPVNTSGIWQLEKYISRVRRLFDIYTDFKVDKDTLKVTIGRKAVPNHNIDFASSDFQRIQESYSSEAISKISVVGEGTITDYYLFSDGSYGTDPEGGTRAKGKWEFRESADNIGYVFASNADSHLLQFRSFKRFEYGDAVTVRSNGRVIHSHINQILKDSKDGRYLYKTGNLTDSASETIQELEEDVAAIKQELEFNDYAKSEDIITDYEDMSEKPSINGVTLSGNKTSQDLGITASSPVALLSEQTISGNTAKQVSMGSYQFFLIDVKISGHRTTIMLPAIAVSTSTQGYFVFDGSSTNAEMQIWKSGSTLNIKRDGSTACTVSVYAW